MPGLFGYLQKTLFLNIYRIIYLSSKGQLPNSQVTITFFAPAVQFFIATLCNAFYWIYLAKFWWWGDGQEWLCQPDNYILQIPVTSIYSVNDLPVTSSPTNYRHWMTPEAPWLWSYSPSKERNLWGMVKPVIRVTEMSHALEINGKSNVYNMSTNISERSQLDSRMRKKKSMSLLDS